MAILLGGAVAMSSTAIVLRQLTEQDELNRTHGRLAFGTLLFQDLAVVPFLALAGVLASPQDPYTTIEIALAVLKAAIALVIVLAAGRWLLRPMFHEIASSGAPELFTFAVLFVAIGASWATHAAGLTFALGAFLAGMMLAETEYRYQVEAGIRPFRDTLLGLFFVTVGMQFDVPGLLRQLPTVIALLVGLMLVKTVIATLAARPYAGQWFKALRTGIVLSQGGEFGFALLALLLQNRLIAAEITQPFLAAITLSMLVSPMLIRHNKRIAQLLLHESGPSQTELGALEAADQGAGRARARDPLRLRPRRPEHRAGARRPGLRVHRDGPRSVAGAHRARGRRPGDLRRRRRRGHAAGGRPWPRQCRGRSPFPTRTASLAIVQAVRRLRQDVPVLVRTMTTRSSRSCWRPVRPRSCRRRSRPR